jgi:hypothetical protein
VSTTNSAYRLGTCKHRANHKLCGIDATCPCPMRQRQSPGH